MSGDHRVTFRIYAPKASEVTVSGDWMEGSGAGAQRLEKDDKGVWSATVGPLVPDFYSYTLTVDDVKTIDPKNAQIKAGVTSNDNLFGFRGRRPSSRPPRWFPTERCGSSGTPPRRWTYRAACTSTLLPATTAAISVSGVVPAARRRRRRLGLEHHRPGGLHPGQPAGAEKGQPMIVVMPNGSLTRPSNVPRFTPGTPPTPEARAAMEAARTGLPTNCSRRSCPSSRSITA